MISKLCTYCNAKHNKMNFRNGKKVVRITPHSYIGQVTAKQGVDYLASTSRECSANYVIGYDGSIGCCVPEEYRSWCSSNRENDYSAITIELACDKSEPYTITEACRKAFIELCVDIAKRYDLKEIKYNGKKEDRFDLSKNNITLHQWFANTGCPMGYIKSHMPEYVKEINSKLNVPVHDQAKAKTKTVYRIQAGAYKAKDSADVLKRKLKELKYSPFFVAEDGLFKLIAASYSTEKAAKLNQEKLAKAGITTIIKKATI